MLIGIDDVAEVTVSDSSTGGSTASATVFVEDGSLHASVEAFSLASPTLNVGNASAFMRFTDTVVFTGAPTGTEVQIEIGLLLSYGLLSTDDDCAGALSPAFARIDNILFFGSSGLTFTDSNCDIFDNMGSATQAFSVTIGQEYTVTNQLSLFAQAAEGHSSSVNALNTSSFFIDSEFGYLTASGNTYPVNGLPDTSVPEPATLLLLGTGLVAVGYRRRRKQS